MTQIGMARPWQAGRAATRPHRRKSSDEMLLLFLTFQQTRCRAAARTAGDMSADAAALGQRCDVMIADMNDQTKANPTWPQAYQIERELLLVQSGPTLLQELRLLLDRADAEKNPNASDLRKSYESLYPPVPPPTPAPAPTDAQVLALAILVLEKLQWARSEAFKAAPLKRRAISNLVSGGLGIFILFVLPYAVSDISAALHASHVRVRDWSWMPVWTALTAGLLGSFFSRLWTVQNEIGKMTLDDVESTASWFDIALRAAVGMLGSLIVFFFLQSGIVSGSLFPNFGDVGLQDAAALTQPPNSNPIAPMLTVPSQALAMLVVWSFIAGFSQRLVPDILAKTEAQLSASASSPGTTAPTPS